MNVRNEPSVVAEVEAAFYAYEQALANGDVAAMTAAFDDAPGLVRFGIDDIERGPEQLAAWRERQPPPPEGRTLTDTTVATFGLDFAVVLTLFTYPGRPKLGRQSQTWARLNSSWKIIHAHVSETDVPLVQ
jgi:ketosteroid isomerase-like protein